MGEPKRPKHSLEDRETDYGVVGTMAHEQQLGACRYVQRYKWTMWANNRTTRLKSDVHSLSNHFDLTVYRRIALVVSLVKATMPVYMY